MAKKRRLLPIGYLELDGSAELHYSASGDLEAGAHKAMTRLRKEVAKGGDGINWAALYVTTALVDSPLGDALEALALSPHRPVGVESLITIDYLDTVYAAEEGMKYLTGPRGSMRDEHGALRDAWRAPFADQVEKLEQRLKKKVRTAERYVEKRGGRKGIKHSISEEEGPPSGPFATLKRALLG